jgi:hypothetical protein
MGADPRIGLGYLVTIICKRPKKRKIISVTTFSKVVESTTHESH